MTPIQQIRYDKEIMESKITEAIREFLIKHPDVVLDISHAQIITRNLNDATKTVSAIIDIEVKI